MIYVLGLTIFIILILPAVACVENCEYEGYEFTWERVTDGLKFLGKMVAMLLILFLFLYLLINSVEYVMEQ